MKKNYQTKLDEEMVELGRQRYQRKVRKAKEMEIESTTSVGQRMLGEAIGLLSEAIKEWMQVASKAPGRRHRAYPFLVELPTDVVAALTARTVLDAISYERKITSTATTIGRILEDEYKFRRLKQEEPALWQQMNRVLGKTKSSKTRSKFINNSMRFHEIVLAQWDLKDATAVGLTVIELMRQSTGIIDIKTRTDIRGKSYTYIQPTDDVMKWMRDCHEYNELLNPVWLPMVENPVDWNNPYIGGYPATNHRRRPLIKTQDSAYLEELAETDLSDMYSAINTVQNTKYMIDAPLLDIFKKCWERGLVIGGVPSMDDERIPNKPADIGTNEESRRRWRKIAARTHFENDRMKSKRLQVMKVLQLANKFSDDILRFPIGIDFRARGYPVPPYLNVQGPEYASSLLSFHQGKKLSDKGVEWMYRHTASMWGLDKKTFEERLAWTEDNMELILGIGSDPFSDMTWTDADKPWKFLKSCQEVSRLHEVGQATFISHLPLSADAVNQGLQLYSILGKDQVGGKATNVVPTTEPEDVYEKVAMIVERKLYEENSEYGNKWLAFGIDRNTTKRQTMTVVYSSTFYSCRSYTAEWFYAELKKGKENPFGEETYRPCNYLAEKIWESIGEVVSSARVIMDWIKDCTVICLDNDVVPRWFTPLGFPVKMNYEKTDKYSVKTLVSGILRQHRLRIPNGEVNRRRILNAICPNFIHSLDGFGGLLGGVVLKCKEKKIKSFGCTHDEYEVLAEDMEMLHHSIREVSVEIFSEDILNNFRNDLSYQLPLGIILPEVPPSGSLDIMDILKSKYYFN